MRKRGGEKKRAGDSGRSRINKQLGVGRNPRTSAVTVVETSLLFSSSGCYGDYGDHLAFVAEGNHARRAASLPRL